MSKNRKNHSECGPVIACGAAAVSLNHEPGEPTSIDMLVNALKNFARNEHPEKRKTTRRVASVEPKPAH